MAHTIRDKKKLLHRVHRIRGQLDAVEHALDQEQDCAAILMTIAACRAALIATLLPDPGTPEERQKLCERIGGNHLQHILAGS